MESCYLQKMTSQRFSKLRENFKKPVLLLEILIWYFNKIRKAWRVVRKRKSDDPNGALQTHFIVGLIYLLERIVVLKHIESIVTKPKFFLKTYKKN